MQGWAGFRERGGIAMTSLKKAHAKTPGRKGRKKRGFAIATRLFIPFARLPKSS
jgi:hypothetical protein